MKDLDMYYIFRKIRKPKTVITWLDKLTFPRILILWLFIITFFGLLYYFFANGNSFLFWNINRDTISTVADSIYFSFITATTTGYGDVLPTGAFKIIAIVEVIAGLLLLALVTSKLVSIKQDAILGELYELSLTEKINRLRSTLLLFRQNLSRQINKIETGKIKKREIKDLYVYTASLEDVLIETKALFSKKRKNHFVQDIDHVSTELIFSSILKSFERLNVLIAIMNRRKVVWKSKLAVNLIKKCIDLNEELFKSLNSKNLMPTTLEDLKARKDIVIPKIKKGLVKKRKK